MVRSSDGNITVNAGKRPRGVVVCLTRPMEEWGGGSLQFSVQWGTAISTTRSWSHWNT